MEYQDIEEAVGFSIDEFQGLLEIDRNSLDDELIQQSQYYYDVCNAYANAISIRDAAYENIKTIDADVSLRIRQDADDEGRKITEGLVQAEVLNSSEHRTAYDYYLEAKNYADRLSALRDAFSQRSYMLRDLIQLFMAGYFMSSGIRNETGDAEYASSRAALSKARKSKK